jgi:Arc/MetJ family transcription regulator
VVRNISSVKHLVDLDEEALASARAALGTRTIKDTVNTALALAAMDDSRREALAAALDRLARVELTDQERADAWR